MGSHYTFRCEFLALLQQRRLSDLSGVRPHYLAQQNLRYPAGVQQRLEVPAHKSARRFSGRIDQPPPLDMHRHQDQSFSLSHSRNSHRLARENNRPDKPLLLVYRFRYPSHPAQIGHSH
jgi:hypothetical protein